MVLFLVSRLKIVPMKFFKNLKIYLILAVVVVVSVLLILNKYAAYGILLLGAAAFIYLLWETVIRARDEKIAELAGRLDTTSRQMSNLQAENNELRSRRLNISELRNILDLGLLQVNSSFTRTWNDKFDEGGRSLHFIGALQVRIVAKYGIDIHELRIKYDREKNEVLVANVKPKFLSFNDFDYEWKIAEVMEYKKPWVGSGHWRKSPDLEGLAGNLKEELRVKTHQEVKQGPAEMEWVLEPLKKQITGTLEMLLGAPYRIVTIVEHADESFKKLEDYFGTDPQALE
jgi:hypothetical protein